MRAENIEAMKEILYNCGVTLDDGMIGNICYDYENHLSAMKEMESYQHVSRDEKCFKCAGKDEIIKSLEDEISVYKEGVKKRHPRATYVYIENQTVKYDI